MDNSIKESIRNKKAVASILNIQSNKKLKLLTKLENSSINAINKKYGIDKNAYEIGEIIKKIISCIQ